ncbi:MAG: hypothetical protein Fur003_4660 [Candidatus Dojkabacteria bacterium]
MASGWFATTYALFLRGHGLTLLEMNSINSLFMMVSFLFDPITGPIGDRLGQKKTYNLGVVMFALGTLVYFFSQEYWAFLIAEAVSALGYALQSEALESWVRTTTDKQTAHKIISNGDSIGRLGNIPTALLGSYLGSWLGLKWPWLFSAITAFVAIAMVNFAYRNLPDSKNGHKFKLGQMYQDIFAGVKELGKNKELTFITFFGFLTTFLFQPINMFWALLISDRLGNSSWLGYIWIGVAIATSLGTKLAGRSDQISRKTLSGLLLGLGVPILLAVATQNPLILIGGMLLHEIGRGAIRPMMFTYANEHIEDSNRFTMNSLRNSFRTFGATLGLLAFGWVGDTFLPENAWAIAAFGLMFYALAIYVLDLIKKSKIR